MILETSMRLLLLGILYSLAFGILLGLIFDAFKIIRIALGSYKSGGRERFKRIYSSKIKKYINSSGGAVYSYIVTTLFDLLFFITCGALFSVFLYVFNFGIFRWFLLAGALAGFRLYYITLGKAVTSVSVAAADSIVLIFNVFINLITVPVFFIFKLIKYPFVKFVYPAFGKIAAALDIIRLKRYNKVYIRRISEAVRFR